MIAADAGRGSIVNFIRNLICAKIGRFEPKNWLSSLDDQYDVARVFATILVLEIVKMKRRGAIRGKFGSNDHDVVCVAFGGFTSRAVVDIGITLLKKFQIVLAIPRLIESELIVNVLTLKIGKDKGTPTVQRFARLVYRVGRWKCSLYVTVIVQRDTYLLQATDTPDLIARFSRRLEYKDVKKDEKKDEKKDNQRKTTPAGPPTKA